ncbi:MAG: helix-turn-helix domain-containing protein [Bacteroidota bacterium]
MSKVSNQIETIADAQAVKVQKKLKKVFGHLDPEQPPEVCPIRDILAPVTDKWSILIVLFLGGYTKLRFNQLKKLLYGVSSKSLSERLKWLEKDGYLTREMFTEVPIRVEYQLTDFGLAYLEKLLELTEWINLQVPEVVKRRYQFQQLLEKKE